MRPECDAEARRWKLALPRRVLHGVAGDLAARGAGASLEFEAHREWAAGDDPRRIDWRAFARTDRLQVRVTRAEVAPALDVIVDVSGSMALDPQKARATTDLLDAALLFGRASGARPRALRAGGDVLQPGETPVFGGRERGVVPRAPLRTRSVRLCISDFLWPGDPSPGLAQLAAGATHLFVVQLLAPSELDPEPASAVALVDCEDETRLDLRLDAAALAAYRVRLERHCGAIAEAARRVGASMVRAVAAEPRELFAQLARAGMLEPA